MNSRRALLSTALSVMMVASILVIPSPTMAQRPGGGELVTGIVQTIPGVGTFVGSLTTTSFTVVNGVINAVGTLTGTFTPLGGVGQAVQQTVTVPITGLTGTCTILTLNTGAINLNLLGLNVALAPINLVITAQAGPGNLLGNLLCAVANLLNAGGPLAGLSALLNQILGAIRV